MALEKLLFPLVLVSCLYLSHGYPSGAPTTQCSTMTPNHSNNTRQTSSSPYKLNVEVTKYKKGEKVKLSITGPQFKGLIIQARQKSSGKVVDGQFQDLPGTVKAIKCNSTDDTFTHNSRGVKSNITVMWLPPNNEAGDIEFFGTVVHNFTTFWREHKSTTLTADYPTPTPPPSGGTMLTAAPMLLTLAAMYLKMMP